MFFIILFIFWKWNAIINSENPFFPLERSAIDLFIRGFENLIKLIIPTILFFTDNKIMNKATSFYFIKVPLYFDIVILWISLTIIDWYFAYHVLNNHSSR